MILRTHICPKRHWTTRTFKSPTWYVRSSKRMLHTAEMYGDPMLHMVHIHLIESKTWKKFPPTHISSAASPYNITYDSFHKHGHDQTYVCKHVRPTCLSDASRSIKNICYLRVYLDDNSNFATTVFYTAVQPSIANYNPSMKSTRRRVLEFMHLALVTLKCTEQAQRLPSKSHKTTQTKSRTLSDNRHVRRQVPYADQSGMFIYNNISQW